MSPGSEMENLVHFIILSSIILIISYFLYMSDMGENKSGNTILVVGVAVIIVYKLYDWQSE